MLKCLHLHSGYFEHQVYSPPHNRVTYLTRTGSGTVNCAHCAPYSEASIDFLTLIRHLVEQATVTWARDTLHSKAPSTISNDCDVAVFKYWPGVNRQIKMDPCIDSQSKWLCQCVTLGSPESFDDTEMKFKKPCSKQHSFRSSLWCCCSNNRSIVIW